MTDLKKLLQDADPLRTEETLSPAEAQVLRTAMLEAAATAPPRVRFGWSRPLAIAAIAIVLIGISGVTSDRGVRPFSSSAPSGTVSPSIDPNPRTPNDPERRQIQFATPGGTRVIWILDPNLPLQESMP
jgi:hypothetical protein